MKKTLSICALAFVLNLNSAEKTDLSAPKIGEIVWNELATTNLQSAKDFYGKVFGWEFIDNKMGEMTYTIIKKENNEFGGIWSIPANLQNQIPPHWLAYILVEDIEKSLIKAGQNGAAIVKPVQKIENVGLFAVIKDPSGAHIAMWQSLKK